MRPTLAAGSANEQRGLPPWYQTRDFSNMASTDAAASQQSTFASNLTAIARIKKLYDTYFKVMKETIAGTRVGKPG